MAHSSRAVRDRLARSIECVLGRESGTGPIHVDGSVGGTETRSFVLPSRALAYKDLIGMAGDRDVSGYNFSLSSHQCRLDVQRFYVASSM